MKKSQLVELYNHIHSSIKGAAKDDVQASQGAKRTSPDKVYRILNSSFEQAFESQVIKDYVNSYTQALKNATTIKVLAKSQVMQSLLKEFQVDQQIQKEVNKFLGDFVTNQRNYQNERETIPAATVGLMQQLIPTFLESALKILRAKK